MINASLNKDPAGAKADFTLSKTMKGNMALIFFVLLFISDWIGIHQASR